MQMTFKVKIGNSTETFTTETLARYAEGLRLDQYAKGRYSWCFVLDLLLHDRIYGIPPDHVIDEIRVLEGHSGQESATKPASEFRRVPLKGLWHKHYFSARFVAKNIQNQLGDNGLSSLIQEMFDTKTTPEPTDEMLRELSDRVTFGQLEQRSEACALTGEWVVFAKHQGENFYLCLATHEMGDEKIYEKIKVSCWIQFPFLDTGT